MEGNAYVIADDEHHLAVFCRANRFGALHRIMPGDLPKLKGMRKKRKPDFEALVLLPGAMGMHALIAMGSGSRRNRNMAAVMPFDITGDWTAGIRYVDLTPLYEPLRGLLGGINIEGAMVMGESFLLLNRGVSGKSPNAVVRYRWRDLVRLMEGSGTTLQPQSIRQYPLPSIAGVVLGFTDGTPLPDGRWLFSAVAENTKSSYADGPCLGSAVGLVSADGDVLSLRRLSSNEKIEGIAARVRAHGIDLCMVTDTDDPKRSAWLLRARI
jgi:hypothetical protein